MSFIYGLYMLGVLSKLILDEYLSNVSKDLLSNRKSFLTKRKPNSGTLWRAVGVGNTLKYLISVDPQGIVYSVRNLEKNASYAVDCQESSCTCKAFVKFGYCKHLLFVLKSNNRPSTTIDLSSVRTFLYRGNTRRAQRGRVPNATSALNRM
jgi:hypothetical protein